MKNKQQPNMAELRQAAYRFRLIIGRQQMQLADAIRYQPRLARHGELFFIGRADNAYLPEAESRGHCETLSAVPWQMAC
ncbi:hypothetical protein [Candidatus Sodalis pierantonius]|uniref:hypothetical protein n=1 Tax=Candidatus Sodalis pierantonii TaxID=1486991 RepID=UPI001F175DF4|nr:hypothetical protein [Candidatus Sodalis pierantonius]